jgi:hypothetical protein
MAEVPATVTEGVALTVTVTLDVSLQPAALVPVTVYFVVAVGVAVGDAHVVQDSPVDGVHT